MISIKTENKIKKVTKPWGYELWLADKENKDRFAFKKIFIKAPYQSSFQFHEVKEETIYIASGHGILHYSNNKIDIEKFKLNQYSQVEIDNIVNNAIKTTNILKTLLITIAKVSTLFSFSFATSSDLLLEFKYNFIKLGIIVPAILKEM